jgi:hypothetical protein
MATVTVGTSPTQLNDGTAPVVYLGNTGSQRATLSTGQVLEPGFRADVKPGGVALTARTALGTTTLTVDTTGVAPVPGVDDAELQAYVAAAVADLALGDAASLDVGTGAGTVAAGNDSRITGAAQKSANLSDLASPSTARTSLGLGSAATMTPSALAADSALLAAFDRKRDLDARDAGAVADGSTNTGPAFLTMLNAAKAAGRTMPFSVASDPVGTKTIYVPPGDHVITDVGGLLGQEATSSKIYGLRFVGDGAGISNIIFKPTTAGALIQNDYWQNLIFEGIGFYAATAGCTLFHSSTTHNGQRFSFINCGFNKFKYNAYLEGNNNNSEMMFFNCHSNAVEAAGAYLRIPGTGSDQFLNYWWFGGTHWSTSAPVVDADKGGHFKVYGLDVSDWGAALAATGYLFKFNGTTHAFGVCTALIDGLRVEAKNAFAALVNSAWGQGNVVFRGVDWSSQAGVYTYGDIVKISYSNVGGASYAFRDCHLAGGVNVAWAVSDWQYLHRIVFEDCVWEQKADPTSVVTYDSSSAGGNFYNFPPVEFVRCRGTANNVFAAGGAAVWDATLGYNGDLLQTLQERVVSIRAVTGVPAGSDVVKFILPKYAQITSFHAMCPAGAASEADGGTWTLATTEGSPTTVGTATVAGAMSAGFVVNDVRAAPFYCDTDAKRTLTVTPTSVSQANNNKTLLLVKGYW